MRLFHALFTAAIIASQLACRVESGADKYTPDELAEFREEHKEDADALRQRLEEAQAQRGDNARRTLSRIERDIQRDREENGEEISEQMRELNEPILPYDKPVRGNELDPEEPIPHGPIDAVEEPAAENEESRAETRD